MKDKSDVLKKAHMDKWKRIFLFTITAIFIYFIMLTVVTPKRYKLNEGDIATVDIKAPRDIIDEEATKAKEQEVTAKVEKKFTLKNEIKIEASENIKSFFDKLINLKSNDIDAFKLSDAEYKTLLDLNVDKDTELQWIALTAIDKGYEKQIEEDNSEDIAEAKTIVDDYLSSQGLESNIEVILREINLGMSIWLIFAGAISAFSMIIPGISGSFIMLTLGVYTSVITAVSEFNFAILIPVAIGILIGLILGIKIVKVLLSKYQQATYMAILGQ